MKLLIVGGAGYIGSRLIPELILQGHTIKVVDKLWFGNHLPKEVEIDTRYISEYTEKDLEGIDQIVFLAGLTNDPMAEFGPWQNFVFNGSSPAYLAYIAKRAKVKRFIYASSCSVYGYTGGKPYSEDSPIMASYPYGIAKLQGEYGVIQLVDNNFSAIALRKGTLAGYSPRMRLDLVVNTMFKNALLHKQLTVNNPILWRPILDIRDCIHAYIKAINSNISGVFNVRSYNILIGEIGTGVASFIERKTGTKIEVITKNIPDLRNYQVVIDKVKEIGFYPTQTLESTLDDLWNNKDKFSDLTNPNYDNLTIYKELIL